MFLRFAVLGTFSGFWVFFWGTSGVCEFAVALLGIFSGFLGYFGLFCGFFGDFGLFCGFWGWSAL